MPIEVLSLVDIVDTGRTKINTWYTGGTTAISLWSGHTGSGPIGSYNSIFRLTDKRMNIIDVGDNIYKSEFILGGENHRIHSVSNGNFCFILNGNDNIVSADSRHVSFVAGSNMKISSGASYSILHGKNSSGKLFAAGMFATENVHILNISKTVGSILTSFVSAKDITVNNPSVTGFKSFYGSFITGEGHALDFAGGNNNFIKNAFVAGKNHSIKASNTITNMYAILNGENNTISAETFDHVYLAGSNLTAFRDDYLHVENFKAFNTISSKDYIYDRADFVATLGALDRFVNPNLSMYYYYSIDANFTSTSAATIQLAPGDHDGQLFFMVIIDSGGTGVYNIAFSGVTGKIQDVGQHEWGYGVPFGVGGIAQKAWMFSYLKEKNSWVQLITDSGR